MQEGACRALGVELSIPEGMNLGFVPTQEQLSLLRAVSTPRHVFLTGVAGTGKTEAIRVLVMAMKAAKVNFSVMASTGVAAAALEWGTTVHSGLMLPMHGETVEHSILKLARSKTKSHTLEELQVLVIDEVSMVSEEAMGDAVRLLVRMRRDKSLPVLVLVGDFYQLPPVKAKRVLGTPVWAALDPVTITLTTIFRQGADSTLMKILSEARVGKMTKDSMEVLESRLHAKLDVDNPTEIHPGAMPWTS